jgi:hypothetical protein
MWQAKTPFLFCGQTQSNMLEVGRAAQRNQSAQVRVEIVAKARERLSWLVDSP